MATDCENERLNYNKIHDLLLEPRKLAKVLVERERPKQRVEVGEEAPSSSSSPRKSKDEPKLKKRLLACFPTGTTLEESEGDQREGDGEDREEDEEGERRVFLRFSFGKSARKRLDLERFLSVLFLLVELA